MRSHRCSWRRLAIAIALAFPAATAPAAAGEKLNILLITSDDHRWDVLGVAGDTAVHTPVLDRLAAEGIWLRQATIHVSQCLPSRATLLTGLTPQQHGALSIEVQRPEATGPTAFRSLPTLPGLLRRAGYTTVLAGKWHLPSDPWRSGFADVRTWLPEGGTDYKNPLLARGKSRKMKTLPGYTQEIFADDAVAFLRSRGAKKAPFLLWLAFTAPHTPFTPNPPRIEALYAEKSGAALKPPGFSAPAEADWRHYNEAVSALDEQVGRVLAALDKAGLAKTTAVIFLGDNGFMMGQRGIGAKGPNGKVVPYEGSLRVPLIVRAPGLAPGISDLAASSLDLPPTLLAFAGVSPPASWPGRNLLPALRHEPGAPPIDDAFSEWVDDQGEKFGKLAHRLVRTPRAKLIVWAEPGKKDELYDLAADPGEEKNLIDDPAAQPLRRDLTARLRAWLEKTADPAREWPKVKAVP
jgi:arylsulfatase A-like enzyme